MSIYKNKLTRNNRISSQTILIVMNLCKGEVVKNGACTTDKKPFPCLGKEGTSYERKITCCSEFELCSYGGYGQAVCND